MAKKSNPYQQPSTGLQPEVTFHDHQAGASIKAAISNAASHVSSVNQAASKGTNNASKGK